MSEDAPYNPMQPDRSDGSNITRTHVVGKVPEVKPLRSRRRKSVKLSVSGKKQFSHLQKRGLISPRAAAMSGLQQKQK